ncbi:MAG TPA: tetratricopeptide repeat protein [Proteobacteria bacterium]|nr:tetratricopeptide repeat protein [Pseudomonadota bacterium]
MGDTPLALRELAIQAGMLDKHREAIELWRRFLKQEKNNAEAWLNLGSALFAVGRTKEALAAAEQACRLQPLMKEPYFNRSLYELHLGYPAAPAADRLKKLLAQVPEYQAARVLHAAAICLRDGVNLGKKAFTDLYDDNLTPEVIAIAGRELAATLKNNHRAQAAKKIKKATSMGPDSSD